MAQAARDTRIAVRYLTALERGAPLEEFPAPVYARAFLREYARYLRLETEPVLQLLTPYEPPPVAPTLAVLRKTAPTGTRNHRRLVALAAAAVLSILLVLGADEPLPQADVGIPAPIATEPAAAPATGSGAVDEARVDAPAPKAPAPGRILTALRTSGRSWLRVTVDRAVVYEGMVPAGWSRSFAGSERVEILIGNAAAVDLVVGGRSLGSLGSVGEVRRLVITKGSGEPVIRNLARNP